LEGWSVKQIAAYLNDVMGFEPDEILNISKDYRFLKKHNIKASTIEGYLFPDTYLFLMEIRQHLYWITWSLNIKNFGEMHFVIVLEN